MNQPLLFIRSGNKDQKKNRRNVGLQRTAFISLRDYHCYTYVIEAFDRLMSIQVFFFLFNRLSTANTNTIKPTEAEVNNERKIKPDLIQ